MCGFKQRVNATKYGFYDTVLHNRFLQGR